MATLVLTRRQWASRLNGQWNDIRRMAVKGFVQLGNDLLRAKAQLGERGQWTDFVENDLKFDERVARMLMRIATWHRQIGGTASVLSIPGGRLLELLPPDYTTIDKLTRLDDGTFKHLIKDGTICPTLQRNEVSKILRLQRVQTDERRVLNLAPVVGKFRTLVFDFAWDYDWLSIGARAKPGYAMQTLDALRALDLKQWADDECHLYLWTTNNFMAEACKLVAHYGWQHRTVITWIKPPPFGLGSYFRNSTEHCLFATLGDTTTRPAAASMSTHYEWPRGEHSEKPDAFYDLVRAASYPPYGEGNQREPRADFANLFIEAPQLARAAE